VKPEYAIYVAGSEDGDVCLDDAERDEDGDFLSNRMELNGQLKGPSWWSAVFQEPIYEMAYWGESKFDGTDWLDPDTDGDGSIDSLDDEDADDFLNIEELVRGPEAWNDDKGKPDYTGDLTGLWVDPYNPCLPSVSSRSCPTARPAGQPGAWRPYAEDPKLPQVPRWPLYGVSIHNNIVYSDPDLADNTGTPLVDESLATGPVEQWDPPVAVDQDPNLAPQHPLPR
jgi:hypothetical protein